MSNIKTSYIRIRRRDGKPMQAEEIEILFKNAVQSCGQFGSYWVRILKKYRAAENCLDIQYGSGKCYIGDTAFYLQEKSVFDSYIVWERVADEGGFRDCIFTYKYDERNDSVDTTNYLDCIYGFDKIVFIGEDLPEALQQLPNKNQIGSSKYQWNIQGNYYACNSRSFMDLHEDSPFYGPSLGYDPDYASDYFVPTADGHIITVNDNTALHNLLAYPYSGWNADGCIELYWKNRLVQKVEKIGGDFRCAAADYWDNCLSGQ